MKKSLLLLAAGTVFAASALAQSPPVAAMPAAAPAAQAPATAATAATAATPAAPVAKLAAATSTPAAAQGQVWVNGKVYHCANDKYFGKTKHGSYMSEADAKAKGAHGVHGKTC